MEAKAVEKYLRMSPRKIRYVVDLVKEKPVEEAVDILTFMPRRAAVVVKKAIESAVSNAVENFKEYKIAEEELFIKEIYVSEGPTLKRWKPRARGRADRVMKRTAHLTVIVSDSVAGEEGQMIKEKKAVKPRKTGKPEKVAGSKKVSASKKTGTAKKVSAARKTGVSEKPASQKKKEAKV